MTKLYNEKKCVTYELASITCDKCKKEYKHDFDLQEFQSIKFIGGYTSVFGDLSLVEADICQDCLKELIGDFCRVDINEHWYGENSETVTISAGKHN